MKNDINKNMSGTESWGPAAWKFLHSVTFNYSDHPSLNEQRNMEQFFYSLKNLLPCDECKNHFENEIRLHPPDTRSKETISSWLVDIHNRINRRLGKQIITYDKAKAGSTVAIKNAKVTNNIDTSKLKVGAKLILRHINFEGSMHRFLPSSQESLEDLLKVMKDNPRLEIQIIGYICCQTEEFGDGIDMETGRKDLSEARAQAVKDYLTGNGIEKRRMTCKGMAAKNKIILQEY